ncbi:sodium- and chloride-dependent GABA transporter 2-like [Physella acuta]|uniref:sodium- and chloride-dependent GABA transporter 2-like n=1 Tax=Physella acuta TaxID=109671 RepID=UPI0027DC4C0C|nr:sodium- and chloride-dependent GABA transporter 2-like [Physella acuta]
MADLAAPRSSPVSITENDAVSGSENDVAAEHDVVAVTENDVVKVTEGDVELSDSVDPPPPDHVRQSVQEADVEKHYAKRETWSRGIDFLFACIGFAVGLGNVWRFPYLCYKNGGGAFLIPYFIAVFFAGFPMFYLEVAIGQYMTKGGLQAWNLVPLFQGVGLASLLIITELNCYYNVILAWTFYYLFSSFTSVLPWSHCNNDWNTEHCTHNFSMSVHDARFHLLRDPVVEFWENKVLGLSDGIDQMGSLKWDLFGCLSLAWFIVYLCIHKGIRSSGKVIYVTSLAPYVFLSIFLIRNMLLDGAMDGISFYMKPNMSMLTSSKVWIDAGTQIFFSTSVGLGTLTSLGSYNKFHHNSYRDSLVYTLVNSGTSILAGFVVFSVLGFMAKQQGKAIADVVGSGPGLAFIAYPKAVIQMPFAPFWSVLFFLMLIFLGIDSQFVGVEAFVTTFLDQFPNTLNRSKYSREVGTALACIFKFLVSISMCFQGGMYVFQLFDFYAASRIVVVVCLTELIAVAYVYGIHRFYDNIMMMIGYSRFSKTLPFMLACWTVITPIFCLAIIYFTLTDYAEIEYMRENKEIYKYPQWAIAIGWCLAGTTAICIPIGALVNWCRYGLTWEVFKLMMVPYHLHEHQMREQDKKERNLRAYRRERKGANSTPEVSSSSPEPSFYEMESLRSSPI